MNLETNPARPAMTDAEAEAEARQIIANAYRPTAVRVDDPAIPSYKDGPRIGHTPPVPQPDKRIVPAWAAGIAVASLGVGAGVTGIGCGAWLVLKGLSAVTLNGVLMATLPFAGLAMVLTAIGGLIQNLKRAALPDIHNHTYSGPVTQHHRTDNRRSVWSKTINK